MSRCKRDAFPSGAGSELVRMAGLEPAKSPRFKRDRYSILYIRLVLVVGFEPTPSTF